MGLSKLPSWATAQVQDRCIRDKVFALDNLSALNTTTRKQTLETFLRLLQDLPQITIAEPLQQGKQRFWVIPEASGLRNPKVHVLRLDSFITMDVSSGSHNFNFTIQAEFSHNMTDDWDHRGTAMWLSQRISTQDS